MIPTPKNQMYAFIRKLGAIYEQVHEHEQTHLHCAKNYPIIQV